MINNRCGGAGLWARLPDSGCAAGVAMLFEVTLVILLGPVKRGRGGDLGDDLPPARLLPGIAGCDRSFLLASVMVEDRRAVLATEIQAWRLRVVGLWTRQNT